MSTKSKKSIIEELKQELEDLELQLKKSGKDFKDTYTEKKNKIADKILEYSVVFQVVPLDVKIKLPG